MLWLHGFGGDALWAWSRNLHDFADTHHIIAPDLLWFGESQGGLTLDAQASAVQKVLEAEGVDTAHVIALSYGGFVALKWFRWVLFHRWSWLALVESIGKVEIFVRWKNVLK